MKLFSIFNFQFSIIFCFSAFLLACSGEQKEYTDAITDRAATPRMHAVDITTVVSDSGITRYRISAPVWNMYDMTESPYWEFPEGIHFERFDLNLTVDANIHSRYAHYDENNQIWELRNEVRATNAEGTLFVTEQMFWNQRTEKVYSDSLITITQADGRFMVGKYGFEANQSLTKYIIKSTSGPIGALEE